MLAGATFLCNVVCDKVSMRNAEVILKAVKFSYKHVFYDNLSTEAIFIYKLDKNNHIHLKY